MVEQLGELVVVFALRVEPPHGERGAKQLRQVLHLLASGAGDLGDDGHILRSVDVDLHPLDGLADPLGEMVLVRRQHLREIVGREHSINVAVGLVFLEDGSLRGIGRFESIDRILDEIRLGARVQEQDVGPHVATTLPVSFSS